MTKKTLRARGSLHSGNSKTVLDQEKYLGLLRGECHLEGEMTSSERIYALFSNKEISHFPHRTGHT